MLKPGDKLGYYKIERILGEGAQAVVYLARNKLLNRDTALKVFKKAPSQESRILKEARIIASLEHQNIVKIYQLENENNIWFLSTEYINGGSISDRIRKNSINLNILIDFAQDMLSGLAHAHNFNIIHNDIKPQNLMIALPREKGQKEVLKLTDFGLASTNNTQEVIGTPLYMAPEIWLKKGASISSDLYAVGACLYHMLIGQPPFRATSLSLLREAHERTPVRFPRKFPKELCEIIEKLMAKAPEARPTSASDVLDALQALRVSPPRVAAQSSLALPALPTPPLHREAASWVLEGLKGSLSKLPCLTRVVARLQTLLRASPPLLLLASPHAPLLNPVIRKGLEGVPEISLVMRCLIDDTSKDCLERLAESLQSRYPGSLAHVHLKRLLDPVEAERLMCSAESFEGHLCLLISGADSLIAALWEQIRASGREGLARRIQIPRPTEEALRVFFKEVAEVARLKGFTADAARQLITLERAGEEGFEIVIHNAVVLARLTSQAFVTTWAITGALAHPTRVDTIDDVEPAWRKPPLAWPPQQEGMRVLETSSMG